jgi:hypothetical protein
MSITTFLKQPAEVLDFDVDFNDYLTAVADTGASHTATAETGITLQASTLVSGRVKVWLAGGTDGTRYKVTTRLTTTGGRLRESEFYVRVKEV